MTLTVRVRFLPAFVRHVTRHVILLALTRWELTTLGLRASKFTMAS